MLRRYKNIIDLKLKYFDTIGIIPKDEIEWLISIANGTSNTSTLPTDEDVLKAKDILDKIYFNYYEEKECSICGKKMKAYHIYDIHCADCLEKQRLNGKIYFTYVYTEKDYDDNFYLVYNNNVKNLTTKQFNNISKIKTSAYVKYFKMVSWIDILKRYNKFDELYNYVIGEFNDYVQKTNKKSLTNFCKQHEYISYRLVESIGLEKILDYVA
jgi:hypothetical protein